MSFSSGSKSAKDRLGRESTFCSLSPCFIAEELYFSKIGFASSGVMLRLAM